MRRALLTASGKAPFIAPAVGDSFMGGYYVGIIDTTKSNIIAADYYQVGQRYALIVAGKSLEGSSLSYKTTSTAAPASSSTLWNGLDATIAMNSSTYPAAQYCYGLTAPTDDASAWYLPAMDELELVYRGLKPITTNNDTSSTTATFPPYSHANGVNPSSSPSGAAYTTSAPAQTSVAAFKTGGAQALRSSGYDAYLASTEYNTASAWAQIFGTGQPGYQGSIGKTVTSGLYTRPVRRLVL